MGWVSDKFNFPVGALVAILFQFVSAVGVYSYVLVMPIYMVAMLGFSETKSTVIYHANLGGSYILSILGALVADGVLGRLRSYLIFQPLDLVLGTGLVILSIYNSPEGIIAVYLAMGVVGAFVGPAIRTFVADQIPSQDPVMLATFLHVLYFINNLGAILASFIAPILHNDIFCFQRECYPLIFLISFLLITVSFLLIVGGLLAKIFVIHAPSKQLLPKIFGSVFSSLKERVRSWRCKPLDSSSWDPGMGKEDLSFARDMKVAGALCLFLLGHPLFWTVFEQMSSVWTLQARYLDGRVSDSFTVKPDQMQTLNPVLVVILIPVFEICIYPVLDRLGVQIPYRIMVGQVLTALACLSMVFVQIRINGSTHLMIPDGSKLINIGNFGNPGTLNVSVSLGARTFEVRDSKVLCLVAKKEDFLSLRSRYYQSNESVWNHGTVFSLIVLHPNTSEAKIVMADVKIQSKGGYAFVRAINSGNDKVARMKVELSAQHGINKICTIEAPLEDFGEYAECGIGFYDAFIYDRGQKRSLGEVTLYPGQSVTVVVLGAQGSETLILMSEVRLTLPSIFWQVVPYVLVTAGEVLFSVNTGVFLYNEAPMSMKSILLTGNIVSIALGNFFILILKQLLHNVDTLYLFMVCGILVTISALLTGILGYAYMSNKPRTIISVDDEETAK